MVYPKSVPLPGDRASAASESHLRHGKSTPLCLPPDMRSNLIAALLSTVRPRESVGAIPIRARVRSIIRLVPACKQ